MKIGVTSQNRKTITGHAGKTRRFLVFSQDPDGCWQSSNMDLPKQLTMHEFRGEQHPLQDLDILITAGCGQGFQNRMQSMGVKVLTTSEPSPQVAVEMAAKGLPLPAPLPHTH